MNCLSLNNYALGLVIACGGNARICLQMLIKGPSRLDGLQRGQVGLALISSGVCIVSFPKPMEMGNTLENQSDSHHTPWEHLGALVIMP